MDSRLLIASLVAFSSSVALAAGYPGIPSPLKVHLQLVWSDEFDRDGALDSAKWGYQTGGGGWGNGEAQFYTDRTENSRIENGNLVIEARKESYEDMSFTSGRIFAKGAGWKYGHVEVRAKMPSGAGTWPAIWMMPVRPTFSDVLWPDNGEIDIMEHVGREPTGILNCFYTKNFNWMNGNGITQWVEVPDAETAYHVYSLDWSEDEIAIGIDGKIVNSFKNPRTSWEDWPFTHEFYLIINLALGGFGGDVDDSIFPQRLQVDYVRIYQPVADFPIATRKF